MLLKHRKKKGYVIEKGFMGREKKVEKEYFYEEHMGARPLAMHVLGGEFATGTPTHTNSESGEHFANFVEKHYDAAGYDALHTAASRILYNYLKEQPLSINMVLWTLTRFGTRNGKGYVRDYNPDNPDLTKIPLHTIVYHKPCAEFYSKHKDEFINKIIENIKYATGKELTKGEEQKLRRGLELAFEYGKRLHDTFKRADEQKYHEIGKMSEQYWKAGFHSVQYAEKALGVDFLEEIGDIVLELNRLFPGFSKPEEVYGDRWYEFLKKKGIDPKTLEPIGAKPKYPQVQKQVEQELRAKGVPEEQVKVIAPRLATAVWLENQIRALKESSFAKIAGGVPASELRALKEKILAKKHVAEKASELVEKEWMRGNIVSLKEEHLDKKLLPLVKEHAAGMLEDIKALAERVKKGELDAQDVRTILAVKRDLLDRTHEAVERTLGNPEHLMENRRAWGVEDKFLVKREAIEKMHEELKPHFETARVRICIKTGENVPEEL